MFSHMIQKHFLNPTRFYILFIDIRVTLVINIITLRPLYMYNIFFIYYTYVFLYYSFIVILSFSQYLEQYYFNYYLFNCDIFIYWLYVCLSYNYVFIEYMDKCQK